MVKLGFIAEGATEKIILEKSDFFNYLDSISIEYIPDVIDAGGNGNLLPNNIGGYSQILKDRGATHILILTDLDENLCITKTRTRISPLPNHVVTLSIKQVESWFLSDTDAIRKLFGNDTGFSCNAPEILSNPYEEIKRIRMSKIKRGPGTKVTLANTMIRNNFSILKAAQHPNCNSAKYFIKKIQEFA
jgi:hypothetical protein